MDKPNESDADYLYDLFATEAAKPLAVMTPLEMTLEPDSDSEKHLSLAEVERDEKHEKRINLLQGKHRQSRG